ncbi:MAG: C40 family peptidase [Clostridiales bacterium]|nr:C40 family peptidase [Clostridiales bacterium]
MNKIVVKAAACCLTATMLIAGQANIARADFEAETPVAGMSLTLNNYFERIDNSVGKVGISELLNPTVMSTVSEVAVVEEKSIYDTIAVSRVDSYVNVRTTPSTDGEVVGKIYDGSAATILSTEGEWYQIESGSVTGYIKTEYFVTGSEAEALAAVLAHRIGTVNTTTLYVRSEPTTESACLTLIPLGEEYTVVEEADEWAKIEIDSIQGWVSKEYLDIRVEFEEAVSIEEERAILAEQEAAKKAAEEARRKANAASQTKVAAPAPAAPSVTTETAPAPVTTSSSNSALGEAIAAYAMQFVGNPYVYGGNSLTKGTDCSGFVKLIYQEFGHSTTRRASTQYNDGRKISVSEVKPGDLVFYGNGSIDHVAIYAGNGKVVHASTTRTGIKVSDLYYRSPYGASTIVN